VDLPTKKEQMKLFKYQVGLLWVSFTTVSKVVKIKPHTHDYCHLLYVKEGRCKVFIANQEYTLNSGQGMLATEGIVHHMIGVADSIARCIEIKFAVLDEHFHDQLQRLPPIFTIDELGNALLTQIVYNSRVPRDDLVNICGAYFVSFLFRLMTISFHKAGSAAKKEITISEQVQIYIDENYSRPLPLQEIANALGYNKSYLCTLFKKENGVTINDYLMETRILKACDLISYSDCSLKQVSQLTGFVSIHYFNRKFKEIVGIPPGQYRSSNLAEYMDGGLAETRTGDPNTDDFISAVLAHRTIRPAKAWKYIFKNSNADSSIKKEVSPRFK
jgi:AraC-like DNA-binding protein